MMVNAADIPVRCSAVPSVSMEALATNRGEGGQQPTPSSVHDREASQCCTLRQRRGQSVNGSKDTHSTPAPPGPPHQPADLGVCHTSRISHSLSGIGGSTVIKYFIMVAAMAIVSLYYLNNEKQGSTFNNEKQLDDHNEKRIISPCKDGIITLQGKFKHTMQCNSLWASVPPDEMLHRDTNYNLYVVYFVNCNLHKGYGSWMKEQLKYVPEDSFLKIVAVSSKCKQENILYENYRTLLGNRNNTRSSTVLECHDEAVDEPTYEYYGIRAMWEIGQMNPHRNAIVYYFHSKGLSHWKTYEEYKKNDPWHPHLTEITLGQVDRVLDAFDVFPQINKAGASGYKLGWIWYNFMFARGSYLRRVEEPILDPERRHYYEDWIARVDFPVEGVHPGNATAKIHDDFGRLKTLCDTYNSMTHDTMVALGVGSIGNLSSNVFNVGTYWNEGSWDTCTR